MSNGRVRRRLVGLGGIRRQILVHPIGLAWACFSPLHQGSETANWVTNKATRNTQVLSKSCSYMGCNSIPASCWPQQATQHHLGKNRSYQEAINEESLVQSNYYRQHALAPTIFEKQERFYMSSGFSMASSHFMFAWPLVRKKSKVIKNRDCGALALPLVTRWPQTHIFCVKPLFSHCSDTALNRYEMRDTHMVFFLGSVCGLSKTQTLFRGQWMLEERVCICFKSQWVLSRQKHWWPGF